MWSAGEGEVIVMIDEFMLSCPVCFDKFTNLLDCCDHTFESHFTLDNFIQAKLIQWLTLRSNVDEISQSNVSMHTPRTSLETVNEFNISLPIIQYHAKCAFCTKFLPNRSTMNHIFDHFEIPRPGRNLVELWLKKFVKTDQSKRYSIDYMNGMKTLQKDSSVLLEKLHLFENPQTKTCRYCKLVFDNVSALYSHCMEQHSHFLSTRCCYCYVCNFGVQNEEQLISHIFERHIKCACGKRFQSFSNGLKHVKSCLRYYVYCKYQFNFESPIALMNAGGKYLLCPYCKDEHTELNQLEIHMMDCSQRHVGVHCPTCQKVRFTDEDSLRQHLLRDCKPWISSRNDEKIHCLNGAIKQNRVSRCISDTNSLKFTDIEELLSEEVCEQISDLFSVDI